MDIVITKVSQERDFKILREFNTKKVQLDGLLKQNQNFESSTENKSEKSILNFLRKVGNVGEEVMKIFKNEMLE